MADFGLPEDVRNRLAGIFPLFPEVDSAVIYGSRAKGTCREGSDIDLVLFACEGGEITYGSLLKIQDCIDDLLLHYKVDLSVFSHIENEALK